MKSDYTIHADQNNNVWKVYYCGMLHTAFNNYQQACDYVDSLTQPSAMPPKDTYIRCTSYWKLKEPGRYGDYIAGGLHINSIGHSRLIILYTVGQDDINVAYELELQVTEEVKYNTIEDKLTTDVLDEKHYKDYNGYGSSYRLATDDELQLYWKTRREYIQVHGM